MSLLINVHLGCTDDNVNSLGANSFSLAQSGNGEFDYQRSRTDRIFSCQVARRLFPPWPGLTLFLPAFSLSLWISATKCPATPLPAAFGPGALGTCLNSTVGYVFDEKASTFGENHLPPSPPAVASSSPRARLAPRLRPSRSRPSHSSCSRRSQQAPFEEAASLAQRAVARGS